MSVAGCAFLAAESVVYLRVVRSGGFFGMRGLSVGIAPFPALGDLTIYLRLAQIFHLAGAAVTYYSNQLSSSAERFAWLNVRDAGGLGPEELSRLHDLVVWDAGAPGVTADDLAAMLERLPNVTVLSTKELPKRLQRCTTRLVLAERELGPQCTVFCLDSKDGRSMVDWIDDYASRVFGLSAPPQSPHVAGLPAPCAQGRKVVLFPMTPYPRKKYSAWGFRRMATMLRRRGWDVSLVFAPSEFEREKGFFASFECLTFTALGDLMQFLADARLVVSNDSGGGHLASMLGVETITITRKGGDFVWRPGFAARNTVLSPLLTIRGPAGHIWRPFVPFWRVVRLAERTSATRDQEFAAERSRA